MLRRVPPAEPPLRRTQVPGGHLLPHVLRLRLRGPRQVGAGSHVARQRLHLLRAGLEGLNTWSWTSANV